MSEYILRPKENAQIELNKDLFYDLRPANWYKTFPFFFEIVDSQASPSGASSFLPSIGQEQSGKEKTLVRFFLPIPPQNMTIQDLSTSEAHATIGGVVEETSAGVFNLITLVGTTGMSPEAHATGTASDELNVSFRKYIEDLTGRVGLAGTAGSIVNEGVNFALDTIAGGIGVGQEGRLPYHGEGSGLVSTNLETENERAVKELTGGESSPNQEAGFMKQAVSDFKNVFSSEENPDKYRNMYANGFTWSHALRQTFLIYQREKAKNPNLRLYFSDVKAGTKYRCVVRSAQFHKGAQNPYLINYNISLKCWNISDIEKKLSTKNIDRFAPGGDLEAVFAPSVDGAITKFGDSVRTYKRFDTVAGAMPKARIAGLV